jgi:photosystem II stability/assembly factor-like uncharacterized protein
MAVDPHDPDILYVGTTSHGIFKSTDKGVNWTTLNNGFDPTIHTFFAIIVDPNDSNILYAGGSELQGGGAGIFKSTDGGANWNVANTGIVDVGFNGPPSHVHSMVIDPTNSNNLYVALGVHCGAVYKSTDAAASWTRTEPACDPVALTLDPNNPNVIYASSDGSVVWKSTTAGTTWNAISQSSFNTLSIDPFNTNTLYGSKHAGDAYKSVDGGVTWTALNSPGSIYRALITDPIRQNTVFMGQLFAGTNRVYVSRDGGANWVDTGGTWSDGVGVRFLLRPANDNNMLYALTDSGLYSYGIVDPPPTHYVTGTVYVDTNGNGVQDNGEQGYEGATVHLFSGPGGGTNFTEVTATTHPDGTYSLTYPGPAPENWVKVDMPAGYRGTTPGIIGEGDGTSDKIFNVGIGSPPTLPTVFSDTFTDTNGTALTDHNSGWTSVAYGAMPAIQDDHLYFAEGNDPLGPSQFVMTDQCMSVDTVTPSQNAIFLHARQSMPNPGVWTGYGGNFNTEPSNPYYGVALTHDGNYFPGGTSIPKAMLDNGAHNLRLCAIGNDLTLYLDNILVARAASSQYSHGFMTIGVRPTNTLDNFKIEGLLVGPSVYPVSTNTRNTSGNNSVTATISLTGMPVGDTATVSVATGTFAGAVGCTDNKGNTYAVAADRNSGQGRVFVCTSHLTHALLAGDTVTATYPGFSGISVISLNGIASFASNGTVLAASSANGNSAAPSSGNITVGVPAVLFGVIAHNSTPIFTPGAGYTLVGQVSGGSGSGKRTLSPEFQIVPSSGTYSAGGTISNGGQFWQAAIVGLATN